MYNVVALNNIPLTSIRDCAKKRPSHIVFSERLQKTPLKIELINCQSLCNKYDEIVDVDILIQASLKRHKHSHFHAKSFQNCQLTFISGGVRIAISYRPHPTKKHGLKTGDFFRELSELVDFLLTSNGHLLILGDFNVHHETRCLSENLMSANLIHHVQRRNHGKGLILDIVINREGYDLVSGVSVSSMLSDHFLINTDVSLERQFSPATSVSYRSYRLIDINAFLLDLPKSLDQLVDLYDCTLRV